MTAYEPRSTWVQGKEFAHPSYGHLWVDEVSRLIVLQDLDPDVVLADREALRDSYERWFRDPGGYVELVVGYFKAARLTTETAKVLATAGVESIAIADPELCLSRPLWREPVAQRKAIARRFAGQRVRVERWLGRVAANGDQTYTGVVVAVAVSTLGSAADLLILQTDEGTTWAISLAQIAAMDLIPERLAP